jgi:hypothetical protein
MNTQIDLGNLPHPYRPGFLLGPLGWIKERLLANVSPQLLSLLFELEPKAMHLLGLAIAHGCDEALLTSLFRQAPKALVERSIGFWPEGIDRLVSILPAMALSLEEYRAIPQLLSDRATARFLQHQRKVDGLMVAGLAALPPIMRRPAIFKLFNQVERMDRFMQGLKYLSERADIGFDRLLSELGAFDQTEQVTAKIATLIEDLPLPSTLPPLSVGSFNRIDRPAEIRNIAKTWRNCLGDYVSCINEGTAAVYRSNNGEPPVVAFVMRFYRLGWLLRQTKGPKNIEIEQTALEAYEATFFRAGIPNATDLAAIRDLVLRRQWSI